MVAPAPGQEIRVALGAFDEIEHPPGGVGDEHGSTYFHEHPPNTRLPPNDCPAVWRPAGAKGQTLPAARAGVS
jgi:hypothetical protein